MPGQSHPGYDEYKDGRPTGRVVGAGAVRPAKEPVRVADRASLAARHSGLARDLKLDARVRDMLLKFDQAGRLSDDELSYLLKFFGVLVTAGDMLGQPYDLFTTRVLDQHGRLITLAAERGWSQALINLYGVTVLDLFQQMSSP